LALDAALKARLAEVLAQPTAPFAEAKVHAAIRRAVRASPRLEDRVDAFGNLLVTYGAGAPRLVFACHTDHPALVSNGDGTATIRGGMRPKELAGTGVRSFGGEHRATLGGHRHARVMNLRGRKRIPKGTPLVLDLPDLRLGGGRIRSRAIDDLCAVAACLATADRLAAARWQGTVGFLFTRAEEVGFAGALGFVRSTDLPRSTTIVNLEMSNARPHTPQGSGPILRVGDRLSTFSREVSMALEGTARALARKDGGFRWQRALMDGGACEATVYADAGFPTGALCLPLKNYHNHAARGGMAMEYVHEDDASNLVRWMAAFARDFGRRRPARDVARSLERLWRTHRRALRRTAAEGRG
jgi:endoglucanase